MNSNLAPPTGEPDYNKLFDVWPRRAGGPRFCAEPPKAIRGGFWLFFSIAKRKRCGGPTCGETLTSIVLEKTATNPILGKSRHFGRVA